jgi:hypothetical protein
MKVRVAADGGGEGGLGEFSGELGDGERGGGRGEARSDDEGEPDLVGGRLVDNGENDF